MILPHYNFGSRSDKKGLTTDPELGEKNFGFTYKTLGGISSKHIVDGFSTVAEYIEPTESETAKFKRSPLVRYSLLNNPISYADCKI